LLTNTNKVEGKQLLYILYGIIQFGEAKTVA